jgi:hypothetical protein
VPTKAAKKEQDQNNQDDGAHADGVIAPVLAVWPDGKTPHKRYDKNDRQSE